MSNEKIINDIETKYQQLGENPETYLKGLLHAKPINYWDYVEADTLLSLQKPRTNFQGRRNLYYVSSSNGAFP
jgi:tryptophan 2,3-dioxygenase